MYMYLQGRGRQPLGVNLFFINTFIESIESFAARFSPINDFVSFPHSNE